MFRFEGVVYINLGINCDIITPDQFFLAGGSLADIERRDAVFMSSKQGDADKVYWEMYYRRERGMNDPYPFLCKGCYNDTVYYIAGVCPFSMEIDEYLRDFGIYCVEDVVV